MKPFQSKPGDGYCFLHPSSARRMVGKDEPALGRRDDPASGERCSPLPFPTRFR